MAYETTATRRRPQKFEDMVGQDFVVETLQKSIAAGKIAPAYLFSGPRGCGKTSSARILAKALNCEEGPTATPCGVCKACEEITRGASFDVIEIDGASNTSVNDVRQIKEEVLFPPNSFKYKIYIIDEVHMLSTSAFNALLKTIEEPPAYVIFIFATTELHKVPATIKSRCQQFNFRLVSVEQLKEVLAEAASETGVKAEDEALYWIAREATGSVRDAYTLYDQVAAFSDGVISFDLIRDKLGLVGVDRLNPLIDFCVDKKLNEALLVVEEILQAGVSVEQFSVDLANYFRNILLIKSGIEKESLIGQKVSRYSEKALKEWSVIQIERALSICLQLYRDLRYSLDARFELELAVSRLAWLSDYVSSKDMKKVIGQARNILLKGEDSRPFDFATGSNDDDSQDSSRFSEDDLEYKPEQKIVEFENLKDEMVGYFEEEKNIISVSLSQTSDWKLEDRIVFLFAENAYTCSSLTNEKRILEKLASDMLGFEVSFSIEVQENEACEDKNAVPEHIEKIREMFRGTIL